MSTSAESSYSTTPTVTSFPSLPFSPQTCLSTHAMMKVAIPGKGALEGVTLLHPTTNKPKCHQFSRVPYASPPTGPRRWRKPQPLPRSFSYGSDTDPGQYTTPCSVCPQARVFGRQSAIHDEGCLQSNIWIPLGNPPNDGWPVFFYIREFVLRAHDTS